MALPNPVRRWLRYALDDLKVARAIEGMGPSYWRGCAYHSQQAVEKTLKGHLAFRQVRFTKTHDIVEGRTLEAASSLWKTLPEETRSCIDAVAMDMWDAFITSTKTNAPGADIVHDKFHISKYLGDAADKVRRQEHRAFVRDDVETLKGAKYLFLKRRENMSEAEKFRFNELRLDKLKSGRAWSMKEMFSEFWTYTYQGSARNFFDRWYWWATHSRLKPMSDVAKLMRRHLDNILTYLRHHITCKSLDLI